MFVCYFVVVVFSECFFWVVIQGNKFAHLTNLIGDLIENIVTVSCIESHSACDTITHLKGNSLHPLSKLGEIFTPGITVVVDIYFQW